MATEEELAVGLTIAGLLQAHITIRATEAVDTILA
jgi:hypothetical protein